MSDLSAVKTKGPDVAALISAFKGCSPYSGAQNRVRTNEDIRFNLSYRTPDGKKRSTPNTPAFPWPGANNACIPLADEVILDAQADAFNAFWRAWMAPKMGSSEESNYAVKLADHLVNSELEHIILEQVALSESYRQTYGWVGLHSFWEQEIALHRQPIKLATLLEQRGTIQQALAQMAPDDPKRAQLEDLGIIVNMLPELIKDPIYEEQAATALQWLHGKYAEEQMPVKSVRGGALTLPPMKLARMKEAVRELRTKGEADLPVPYLCKNRPNVCALKPWTELLMAEGTRDVQKAPVLFHRLWYTEEQLRAKAALGWTKGWIEAAIQQKGKHSVWAPEATAPPTALAAAMAGTTPAASWQQADLKDELIEVVAAYERQVDDDQVPGIYLTIFHASIGPARENDKDAYAEHKLVDATQNEVPFVTGKREITDAPITSSRGVPEVVSTWQREMKVQHDGVADWTSIGVLPPINKYHNAMGTKYEFGPGVQNTVMFGREPKFMEIPSRGVPVSFEMMDRIERDVDKYYGRPHADLPPKTSKQQMSIGFFLLMWSQAVQQMVNLFVRFGDDAEFARVTGAPEGWLEKNRHTRLLSAKLECDVRELNTNYVIAQLEAINKTVLPQDVTGVTNRAKLTKIQWRMISPMLARELVQDETAASQQIYKQVMDDLIAMYNGNDAPLVEMDPTAPTKLKYIEEIIFGDGRMKQGNMKYQAALGLQQQQGPGAAAGGAAALPGQGSDEDFKRRLENYAKMLTQSVTQEDNKLVGRIGYNPKGKAGV